MGQRGLAYTGHSLDEQMSTGQHRNQGEPDNVVIAANDGAQGLFQRCGA